MRGESVASENVWENVHQVEEHEDEKAQMKMCETERGESERSRAHSIEDERHLIEKEMAASNIKVEDVPSER